MNDNTLNKAADVLREMSGDARLREAARLREKRLHDEASELASAREEGKIEGRKEGNKEGGLKMLINLVKKGTLSMNAAAEEAQMSVNEFQALYAKS